MGEAIRRWAAGIAMSGILPVAVVALSGAAPAAAQDRPSGADTASAGALWLLKTRDGSSLVGRLVSAGVDTIRFETSGGLLVLPRAGVAELRRIDPRDTHNDPDWQNLTYGDDCRDPRSTALRNVVEDDILLFWALLWRNTVRAWDTFTGERGWYLIGALRVREILEAGQRPTDAKPTRIARAQESVQFVRGRLDTSNRLFLGCTRYSRLFPAAVDLQVGKPSGLLYRTLRTAQGTPLRLGAKPDWNSSLTRVAQSTRGAQKQIPMCSLQPLTCLQVQVLPRQWMVGPSSHSRPWLGETPTGASSAVNGRASQWRKLPARTGQPL